jgi:radical SAM protein with 4Fe4S-binding SPASM domain
MPAMDHLGFQWHLTDRCNLRCAHCYQHQFERATERSLADWCRVASNICDGLPPGSVSINLTGGEPLLLPELPDLVACLAQLPPIDEICVITNGTVVAPTVLTLLQETAAMKMVKISLEAGQRQVNDRLRGQGNLARVERNLQLFRETGKSLVLMMTLSAANADFVESTVEWARRVGFSGVMWERFVPLGRGQAMADQVLDRDQWARVVRAIARAAEVDLESEPETFLPFRAFWLTFDPCSLQGALCNLGPHSMAVMPDGTVYPCRRLPLSQGNVLHESFADIRDRLGLFELMRLRGEAAGPTCRRCGVDDCVGCRALVHAVTGSLSGDDPQCQLAGLHPQL